MLPPFLILGQESSWVMNLSIADDAKGTVTNAKEILSLSPVAITVGSGDDAVVDFFAG